MKHFVLFFLLIITSTCSVFANQWELSNKPDPMGRGNDEIASVKSENTFELQQPYSGIQHATFVLRKLHNADNEFVIALDRGQLVCGTPDCFITARIDDQDSTRLKVSSPKDGSTNILIGSLDVATKRAITVGKKLLIETTVFQNGEQIFEFNIADTPFKGSTGYLIGELKAMKKSGKGMPEADDNKISLEMNAYSFKICRQAGKESATKDENDSVNIINSDTKTDFVSTEYSQYSIMRKECKKGSSKSLITFYHYK